MVGSKADSKKKAGLVLLLLPRHMRFGGCVMCNDIMARDGLVACIGIMACDDLMT